MVEELSKMREFLSKRYGRKKIENMTDEAVKRLYQMIMKKRSSAVGNIWKMDDIKRYNVKEIQKMDNGKFVEVEGIIGRLIDRTYTACPTCLRKVSKDERLNRYKCSKHGYVTPVDAHLVSVPMWDETGEIFLGWRPIAEDTDDYIELVRKLKEDAQVLVRGKVRRFVTRDGERTNIDVYGIKIIMEPIESSDEGDEDEYEGIHEVEEAVEEEEDKSATDTFEGEEGEFDNETEAGEEDVAPKKISKKIKKKLKKKLVSHNTENTSENKDTDTDTDEEFDVLKSVFYKIKGQGSVSKIALKFICGSSGVKFDDVLEYLEELDNGKYKLKAWVEDAL